MPELIWTQADVDALKASIRRGVLSVTFGDQTTTFHSLKEMRELLAEMVRSSSGTTTGFRLAAHSKDV